MVESRTACKTQDKRDPEVERFMRDITDDELFLTLNYMDTENQPTSKRLKKIRMKQVNSPGMTLLKSAFEGTCNNYFQRNFNEGNLNYNQFLCEIKPKVINVIKKFLENGPVKINLKLESTYIIPNTEIIENRTASVISSPIYDVTIGNNFGIRI